MVKLRDGNTYLLAYIEHIVPEIYFVGYIETNTNKEDYSQVINVDIDSHIGNCGDKV